MDVFVLDQTCNMLCVGSKPKLPHWVLSMGTLLPCFREGMLSKPVCKSYMKLAGLTLQALKSLFTVEQHEILVALKSARPLESDSEMHWSS